MKSLLNFRLLIAASVLSLSVMASDVRIARSNEVESVDDISDVISDAEGLAGEAEGWLDGLLSPITSFLDRIDEMRQDVLGDLSELLGDGGLNGAIEEALGALNIPDPQAVLDDIFADIFGDGSGGEEEAQEDPINNVQAIHYAEALETQARTLTGDIFSNQYLSEENQEAVRAELERMQQLAAQGIQLSSGTAQLSQQSAQTAQLTGEGASSAMSASESAQGRTSTQDAVKDLASIGAIQAGQLSQLAQISSAQSGQLGNISLQLADQTQIDASQLFHMTNVATGVAVVQQSISEIAEVTRGEQHAQIIQGQLENNALSSMNSQGYRIFY